MSTRKRHLECRHLLLVAGATLAVTWAAVAATAQASAAGSAREVLGGFTSQGWPVVVVVSGDRSHVIRVGIGLTMRCTSGVRFSQRDGGGMLPIRAGGKVQAAATIAPIPAAAGSPESLAGGSDLFAGRLGRGGAAFSGVWRLRLVFRDTGGHTDTCDSGRVTFAAA